MDDLWTRRAREIFGNPKQPSVITEEQFDGAEHYLREVLRIPWQKFTYGRRFFWAYYHDLTYAELQPDLFAYAFPLCLGRWRYTLMHNRDCSRGDSDFHRSLHRSEFLAGMMTEEQQAAVIGFFIEGMIERMDAEKCFHPKKPRSFHWLDRMNALAKVCPVTEVLLPVWFKAETRGRAMCLIEWLWLLTTPSSDPDGMWDSLDVIVQDEGQIWDAAWRLDNLSFLESFATHETLTAAAEASVNRLKGTRTAGFARGVAELTRKNPEFIRRRLAELVVALAKPLEPGNDYRWDPDNKPVSALQL